MLSTPDFWVFIAFIIFLAAFGKRAFVSLTQALDNHRQKITEQLDEAQRLHDEALSLLNAYKKKHEEALEQAEKILSFAESEALEFKKMSLQEFETFIENKEKALLERITVEKEETKSKLRQQVLEEALVLVETLIAKDPKVRKKLTEDSLREITKLSHQES